MLTVSSPESVVHRGCANAPAIIKPTIATAASNRRLIRVGNLRDDGAMLDEDARAAWIESRIHFLQVWKDGECD